MKMFLEYGKPLQRASAEEEKEADRRVEGLDRVRNMTLIILLCFL